MTIAAWLTRRSVDHPGWVASIVLVSTVMMAIGIPHIQKETTARTFLGDGHPLLETYDAHIERFSAGYPVILAYSCAETDNCETIVDVEALAMASRVETALNGHPAIARIRSPASEFVLSTRDGGLVLSRMSDSDVGPEERESLARRVLEDPLWQRALVGNSLEVGAIIIEVESTEGASQAVLARDLEGVVASEEARGWRFHQAGEVIDFAHAGKYVERESSRMGVPLSIVLAGVLFLFFRRVSLVGITLLCMGVAFAWTSGAMGWSGVKINALTSTTPSLVMAVAVLDAVHLVVRWLEIMARIPPGSDRERREALVQAAADIGRACVVTSLTTMAAFLAFLGAGISAFTEFGMISAFGVGVAFLVTFTLLPAALRFVPIQWIPRDVVVHTWDGFLEVISGFVRRRSRGLAWGSGALLLICIAGFPGIRVDISPEQLAGTENPVTQWSRWIAKRIRATEGLEIALELPAGVPVTEPVALEWIGDVSTWIERELPGVHHPRSVYDLFARARRLMNDDDPEFEKPAATRPGNAQLQLLLTLRDPTVLEPWVRSSETSDGRLSEAARVFAEVEGALSTSQQAALAAKLRDYLDRHQPDGWSYSLAGSTPLYTEMMHALERNQLRSFAAAAVAIFLVMLVVFRSWKMASLAMIPSVFPCAVALGLLGWAGIPLDPGSTMVATIILGVGVDDSIHILTAYRRARRKACSDATAITEAIRNVGMPVIISSLMLSAGFFAMTLSGFSSIATFGFLAGTAVLCALGADLVLLPSLLHVLSDTDVDGEDVEHDVEESQALPVRRRLFTTLTVLLIGVMWVHTFATHDDPRAVLGCWVLPDGAVSVSALTMLSCPLRPYERITHVLAGEELRPVHDRTELLDAAGGLSSIAVGTVYRGNARQVDVPVIHPRPGEWVETVVAGGLAAGLLVFAGLILWSSSAPSAAPLSLLCTVVGMIVWIAAFRGRMAHVDWIWPLAQGLVPAAALHLAVTLQTSEARQKALRPLVQLGYGFATIAVTHQIWSIAHESYSWQLGDVALAVFAAAALFGVVRGTLLVWNLGPTFRQRIQARALLLLIIGLAAIGFGVPAVVGATATEVQREWFGLALLGCFLSIVSVAGRAAIAEVSPWFRSATAYLLHSGAVAGTFAAVALVSPWGLLSAELRRPILAATGIFLLILSVDQVRRLVGQATDRWLLPFPGRASSVARNLSRSLSEGLSVDGIAQSLGHAIDDGIGPRGVVVFVRVGEGGWRRAYSSGRWMLAHGAAQEAVRIYREQSPVEIGTSTPFLALGDIHGVQHASADRLANKGVEAASFAEFDGRVWAVALLRDLHRHSAYMQDQQDFLTSVCGQAAIALAAADRREQQAIDERASISLVTVAGLAHDLGRPLGEAQMITDDLLERTRESKLRSELEGIREATRESLDRLYEFAGLIRSRPLMPRRGRVDQLLAAASGRVSRSEGRSPQEWVNVYDACVPDAPSVQRVIENLLENSYRWGGANAAVRLEARLRDPFVECVIEDDGVGMTREELSNALKPFQSGGAGQGLGLSIVQDVVANLGGTLEIDSSRNKGTRALVRVPCSQSSDAAIG